MLDPARARPPVADTPSQRRNPLVDLPIGLDDLTAGLDAALLTHAHEDHLDETGARRLAADVPLLCQPDDVEHLAERGFQELRPVEDEAEIDGIAVTRTGGQHGHDEMARSLGPVSGFVLRAASEAALYVAGDSVWCPELEAALETHCPDVVVVNAGAARFLEGGPVTMTSDEVLETARRAPWALVLAVHMDAINHCLSTRTELREDLEASPAGVRVLVPEDGERLDF
jgi:L-ascorbate metabolism protein UlaG (beta-lactamase superfamily)